MAERTPEQIVAELERRSRRLRPLLILGLLVIFASLIGSVVYLNVLLREERQARTATEAALQALVDASREPDPSGDLTRAVELARGTVAGQRPDQIALEQLEVHILICEGAAPENRNRAEAFRQARPQGFTQRWRRDYLSRDANALPQYRLTRNEIRYNPEEEEAADRLIQMLRDSFRLEAAKVLTFFPTPRSISVFFCEGANPPALPTQNQTSETTAPAN